MLEYLGRRLMWSLVVVLVASMITFTIGVLMPANPAFKPYEITDTDELRIWGVVTHVVHELLPGRQQALLHSID